MEISSNRTREIPQQRARSLGKPAGTMLVRHSPHFQHVSVRPSVLIPAVSTSSQQMVENKVAYDRETSLLF